MKIRNFFLFFLIAILTMQTVAIGIAVYLDHLSNKNALVKIIDADLEKTYEMYRSEIIGNLIVGNNELVKATLEKIASNENLIYSLRFGKNNFDSSGVTCKNCRTKHFQLEYAGETYGDISFSKTSQNPPWRDLTFLLFAFVPLFLISIFIVVFFHRWFESSVLRPLAIIGDGLKDRDTLSLRNQIGALKTVPEEVKRSFDSLVQIIEDSQKAKLLTEKNQIFKQVSHDIRSPLSALNMIVGTLANLPEDKRILIRASVSRITDIANQLLQKGSENNKEELAVSQKVGIKNLQLSNELLPAIIEIIVSEKRVQFRENSTVTIDAELCESYGLFAKINPVEFKRVISNLINNSIEANTKADGIVKVQIRKSGQKNLIVVSDNGKGIPQSVLDKLGREEISFGKEGTESGSGIGVLHARRTIESFGGTLEIKSQIGVGTEIIIALPSIEAPDWFVSSLELSGLHKVVALDDDNSVLEVWRQRFRACNSDNLLLTFTSGKQLIDWVNANPTKVQATKFLMDFELLGQNSSGLDLIEKLNIGGSAILVTSRYEEPYIKDRCLKSKVKLIPKGMAPFIPIEWS
jgi:signal transduction histidine kinase